MRDNLRRQALESGKTISRKAQSKASSRASSAANSRTASANVSENGSDEDAQQEDGNLSDSTNWSNNGLDDLTFEVQDDELQAWKAELKTVVEEITDRKRSSTEGREKTLASYNYIVAHRYASAELDGSLRDLVPALLKSIKNESSDKETLLAIKALGLTIITCADNDLYESVSGPLKTLYETSQSFAVKAAAVHARSFAAFYGGGDDETEVGDVMDEYLEIIESDGNSIEAGDSHEVVLAALEAWGLLATIIEDYEDGTQEAMEAFVEQLESSYPSIQIAAGENIALLFEKSYTETEEDEVDESGRKINPNVTPYIKRYDAYRQSNQLIHTLTSLASEKHRYLRKKEQRMLHENFNDIVQSVEDPTLGPKYRKTVDGNLGPGSKMTITVGKSSGNDKSIRTVSVDKWWKLHRLNGLRRLLGSGFLVHYRENEVIEDTLPSEELAVSHTDTKGLRSRWTMRGQDDDASE